MCYKYKYIYIDMFDLSIYLSICLVGDIPIYPSEKYDFISWDDDIPN